MIVGVSADAELSAFKAAWAVAVATVVRPTSATRESVRCSAADGEALLTRVTFVCPTVRVAVAAGEADSWIKTIVRAIRETHVSAWARALWEVAVACFVAVCTCEERVGVVARGQNALTVTVAAVEAVWCLAAFFFDAVSTRAGSRVCAAFANLWSGWAADFALVCTHRPLLIAHRSAAAVRVFAAKSGAHTGRATKRIVYTGVVFALAAVAVQATPLAIRGALARGEAVVVDIVDKAGTAISACDGAEALCPAIFALEADRVLAWALAVIGARTKHRAHLGARIRNTRVQYDRWSAVWGTGGFAFRTTKRAEG